jgi:hypothetical protein
MTQEVAGFPPTHHPTVPSHNLELIPGIASDLSHKLLQNVPLRGELIQLSGSKTTLLDDSIETSQLLGGIAVALSELVEDAEVVLGVLQLRSILERLSLLLCLGSGVRECGAGAGEGGDDGVEHIDGASLLVQAAAGGAVGAGLLVDKVHEGLLVAAAGVGLGRLAAGGEELDGRVRADALGGSGVLAARRFGIDLGDEDVGLAGEVGGELLPGRGEGLAVC